MKCISNIFLIAVLIVVLVFSGEISIYAQETSKHALAQAGLQEQALKHQALQKPALQTQSLQKQALQHQAVKNRALQTRHLQNQSKHHRLSQNSGHPSDQDPLFNVNPFLGTTKSAVLTHWGGNGGTYPGAVAPSGAIQLSPETRVTGAKGYDYSDQQIYFFSCIKHYSGFPEGSSGRLFVMPVQAGKEFIAGTSHREFKHQDEYAEPGYYRVVFTDDNTVAEATASLRTGMFRFTFPKGVAPQLFVGDADSLSSHGKKTLYAAFANAVMNFSEDVLVNKQVKGGRLLTFRQTKNPAQSAKVITLKISTSTIDFLSAQRNINEEIGTKNFDQVRDRTSLEWQQQLSTVDITDSDQENKTIFYTALYHSLLLPWVISDSDGRYRGADGKIHTSSGQHEYGGFSPWDTFRSLHPLLTLLYPQKQQDAILSMLDIYQQTGHLPTESMTGNHAVPIIADAWLKGIRGYDKNLAYMAMKKNLMDTPFVQNDLGLYHQLGYVPYTNSESVTRTVEYAYNDWALGQYAKLVMHDDSVYQLEHKRGFNYRNLFNPQSMFMLPRRDKDFRLEPGMTGYKEGNKWVYSWFVPHNPKDLVNLMGGNAAFASRLDSALSNDVVLYDNETVLQLPYLFNTAGHPGLTQKWIRNILLNRYKATPAGLPGNDDLGAMSSAYIFNAMGIFPLSPGRPLYAIAAPLFQSVKLHLAGDKTFTINAKGQSRENLYVQALQLNQQPYEQLYITHSQLMDGGSMDFLMSNLRQQTWPKERDPLILSETKTSALINITDYQVSKTKVAPDERFWVSFSLQNSGSTGTKKVVVYANGQPLSFKNVLVPAASVVKDSVSCRLYDLAKVWISLRTGDETDATGSGHTIELTGGGKDKGGQRIRVAESPKANTSAFEVSEIKLNPLVQQHTVQEISYIIKNLTGRAREFRIPLRTNNLLLFTDTFQLAPGKTRLIAHRFVPMSAGLNLLTVGQQIQTANGLANDASKSAKFKVYTDHLSSLLLDLSLIKHSGDTLPDHSGFGHTALIHGKAGAAASEGSKILLGEDSFVEVSNAVSLDQLGESLTMMCWVYPESGNEKGLVDMLSKGDHHVLQTNNNKTLSFFAGGWGRGDITIDLPENWKKQWHHLAGVAKGNRLWLYVDGKLGAAVKVDAAVDLLSESRWQIGRNEEFPSGRIFHGYMDQIRIFEQALTAEEISTIVQSEKHLFK
jgi:putative alpha-1,2-mannosidase